MIPTLDRLPRRYRVQRTVDWIFAIPFCFAFIVIFRWIARYRVENIVEIRRECQELLAKPGPLLICGNHLTTIDSCLLIWAFANTPFYLKHYNRFTWNLPAGDFFAKKLLFRVVAYLGKCVFVHRDGTNRHKAEILALAKTLVAGGEALTIFPEGRRSRSGRFEVDNLTYGAGKIVAEVPGCRVLCVYLRGNQQNSFGAYPARDSSFYLRVKEIQPTFDAGSREAPAQVTRQIGEAIQAMETEYFRNRGDAA